MKKTHGWLLLFLLLPLFPGVAKCEGIPVFWSGREVVLAGHGPWQLTAEHGRILAAGNGEMRFALPPLIAGTTLDALLTQNGKSQRVLFYSPHPLAGISAGIRELPGAKARRLAEYGLNLTDNTNMPHLICGALPPEMDEKCILSFPARSDFPLDPGNDWSSITLLRTENSGSISMESRRQSLNLDLSGDFTCVILRKTEKILVIFSPEFDLEKIENLLLLKTFMTMTEYEKTPDAPPTLTPSTAPSTPLPELPAPHAESVLPADSVI